MRELSPASDAQRIAELLEENQRLKEQNALLSERLKLISQVVNGKFCDVKSSEDDAELLFTDFIGEYNQLLTEYLDRKSQPLNGQDQIEFLSKLLNLIERVPLLYRRLMIIQYAPKREEQKSYQDLAPLLMFFYTGKANWLEKIAIYLKEEDYALTSSKGLNCLHMLITGVADGVVKEGALLCTDFLLEKHPALKNEKDSEGRTPRDLIGNYLFSTGIDGKRGELLGKIQQRMIGK